MQEEGIIVYPNEALYEKILMVETDERRENAKSKLS